MKKQEFLTALWKQLSDMPNSDVERSLDYYSEMIDDRVEAGMSEEEAVAEIGSVEEAAKQIMADAPKRKVQSSGAGDTQAASTANGYTAGQEAYYSTEGQKTDSMGYNGSTGSAGSGSGYTGPKHTATYNEAYAQAIDEMTGRASEEPRRRSGGISGGKIALLICLFPLWFPLLITLGALIFAAFVIVWALTFSFFVVAGSFIIAGIGSAIALFFFVISGNVAAGFVNLGGGLVLLGLGILMFLVAGAVIRAALAISRGMWGGFGRIFRRREAAA